MSCASHFILFVADQARSTAFYAHVLGMAPQLDVPGMTEFALPGGGVLGLMPGFHPIAFLDAVCHARALSAGARELSPLLARDWGHVAAYSLDPDGHVLAFASMN